MAIPCDSKQRDQAAYIENPKTPGEVDRRVHDVCANDKLDQLIALQGGSTGTPFFVDVQTQTTPGASQELINETVGIGKTLKLKSVRITCRQSASYTIKIDSVIVGSGRVGSGILNDVFVFEVERSASAGSVVKVELIANLGKPASDVECYLQALEA